MHTGGIAGFLKSVGYAIKLLNPTRCVVVFDGPGGSAKRREIYPEYKAHRKTKLRFNRIYEDNAINLNDEEKSCKMQLLRSIAYLDTLPITTIILDNVEADDVIAYLTLQQFKDDNVNIMSSDKDFLQLVSDRVKVWSPTKKKLYGPSAVLDEYGINSKNFIFYRALDGDSSDNIGGISGAGLKTIIKCFPFLTEDNLASLEKIFDYCEMNKDRFKIYRTILEQKEDVNRNYKLMQLTDTQIQPFAQLKINDMINAEIRKLNQFGFVKLINEDRMWNNLPAHRIWLNETFGKLNNNNLINK